MKSGSRRQRNREGRIERGEKLEETSLNSHNPSGKMESMLLFASFERLHGCAFTCMCSPVLWPHLQYFLFNLNSLGVIHHKWISAITWMESTSDSLEITLAFIHPLPFYLLFYLTPSFMFCSSLFSPQLFILASYLFQGLWIKPHVVIEGKKNKGNKCGIFYIEMKYINFF